MKTRIGFVSNSSSSSFIYHCVSECKDLNEFKEKFVEALEKELNSKKWQKRLSPRSIAEKIASETVSYAEDVIEDDRYQKEQLEKRSACCKKYIESGKKFCADCGRKFYAEDIKLLQKEEKRSDKLELELSLGAGGTEGPYDFESFLGQEIMDAWKKNELLEILGTDFEGY